MQSAVTGSINYNVSAVTSALNTVNALNTTLGALPGTNVSIGVNTTINAINGTFSASGTGYTNVRVFNATSFSLGNGQNLTINGDPNGDSVVLNLTTDENFKGNVILTGGLTPDDVIFNFVKGSGLNGGPNLNLSTAIGASNLAQGIFLDPNGMVTVGAGNVFGRVFGGDSRNFQFNGPGNLTAPSAVASPTLTTTPNPIALQLSVNPPALMDTATLSGGNSPTGTITFTLFQSGGNPPAVDTGVGRGQRGTAAPYTTPTGFTLPTFGTVTGTYQWDATYNGDANNQTASDTNALNELVTVSAARPTLSTTPVPTAVTLGATAPPILNDAATLSGAFFARGSITFTLFFSGNPTAVDTETVPVNGNGTYITPTGFALPSTGAVAGTYQWVASYNDPLSNNDPVTDANDPNERVIVRAASPTISTTANPTTVNLGGTLQDTASLAAGYQPDRLDHLPGCTRPG